MVQPHIYIVDDDPCIRDVISVFLVRAGFECSTFSGADHCLSMLRTHKCDLLITDVRMPVKDGIELLIEARSIFPWLPVLIITSYADVPLAVKALKAGATDFAEKPLDWDRFLATVQSILSESELSDALVGKPLTRTETIILRLILEGRSNKEIAHILSRSTRTVEVHRSHIMHKLNVDNVVELVKRAAGIDLS
jgi:two-component system response regulator FixJ